MAIQKFADGSQLDTSTNVVTDAKGVSYSPQTISADNLKPVVPADFATPNPTPVYPVNGLNADGSLAPTPTETTANDETKQIQDLISAMSGKSYEQAHQDQVYGVAEKTQTYNDLASKLKAIQNEALAIPLQLQQDATGRGITAGGLQPLQAGALRKNAIEALTTSSLMESAKGNLSTAQALADRAVAQKYDPIQAEIDAKIKNLNVIMNSPQYTLEQKNRAQAQLDIQNQKKAEAETQKTNAAEILKIASSAAANGADALTLDKISKATTPMEATILAGTFLNENNTTVKNQAYVSGLMTKYPDAGILPTDDIVSAQAKMKNSKIYQNSVRQLGGGSEGGGKGASGTTVTSETAITGLTPEQSDTLKKIGLDDIQANNVAGIFLGVRPPLSGFGANSKEGMAVTAGLNALGYDLTKATADWNAMQKRISTMNGTQQVRLQQAVTFSYDSLDIIEQLSNEWKRTGYPALNKAQLEAAKQGALGAEAQSLATRLDAQINDLTSELGTVYKGGNSSTDESLKLAAGNLNSSWSQKTLQDAINLARTNLQIRKNSIASSMNIPGNIYDTAINGQTAISTPTETNVNPEVANYVDNFLSNNGQNPPSSTWKSLTDNPISNYIKSLF